MNLPEATVTTVTYFDEAPERQALEALFEKHIWPQERFSSRVVDGFFVPVEVMDRAYHFSDRSVEEEAEIDAYVQQVMTLSLDHERPLWTVTILKAKRGRSAMVFRVHHVISDGLGLLFSFLPALENDEVADIRDKIPLPAILLGKPGRGADRGSGGWFSCCKFFCRVLGNLKRCFGGFLALVTASHSSEIKINAPISARKPFLPFSGRHTFTRMPVTPMSIVKAVSNKHGCTVNEVIMSALAGAIRRYCGEDLGDPLINNGQKLKCMCTMLLALPRPVDPANPGASLRNNILSPPCALPIDEPSAGGRLRRTMAMMSDLKSKGYIAGIRMTTKLIASVAPTAVMQGIVSDTISKMTCNVTSIPMPTIPIRFAGKEIKEVQVAFVNTVPQVGFITYKGNIYWNMVSDPELIPDPIALARHFQSELEELAA